MLRNKFYEEIRHMSDDEVRWWAAKKVAGVMDILLALIVAVSAGALIFVISDHQRDNRIGSTDDKFRLLACLALHYTPPDTDFHTDLATLYPDCPKYVPPGIPNARDSRNNPSRTSSSSTTPPLSGPKRSSSPRPGANPAPAPVTRPVAGPQSPVARPDGTRTVTAPAPAPSTVTRPPAPNPTSSFPVNILCSPIGLQVGVGC